MISLGPWVRRWNQGDGVVLWNLITGRHAQVHADTLSHLDDPRLEPVRARLRRLHLTEDAPPPVARLVPTRSRLVLDLPDRHALWRPVPSEHTAGGLAYVEHPLDDDAWALWRSFDGHLAAADVAMRTGIPATALISLLSVLTAPEVQALQLRDTPASPHDLGLERVVGPPRDAAHRPDDRYGVVGDTTLLHYHLHGITDGERHFDDRETTVAHAHGLPHPALGDARFGERLFDALDPESGARVVEIGGGDGELAEAFLARAARASRPVRYLRVDLSPELLRTQARRVDSPGLLADGTRLPLRHASVDLVINNEVMADLAAVPWDPATPPVGPAEAVAEAVARYDLSAPQAGQVWWNLGAWRLVAEIARVLRPGGRAYVSEFGDLEAAPEEAAQLDHPEVSIHFGHLRRVAEAHGLSAAVVPMADLLGFDLQARHLARTSWVGLRALARARGRHLPARAWTPATLDAALSFPVEGVRWVPVAEEGPGPLVTRFHALLLVKPG